MPVKSFIISRKTSKEISKLPLSIQKRIISTFNSLKTNPLSGPKLKGELRDYHKLRLGDYRIIYKFDPKSNSLEILKIEHRQGVYK